jgi:hypothetical protein
MPPDITEIVLRNWPGNVYVGAKLSSELLPGCGYLMITHFKWSYWLFHGAEHLLFDRTIDRCFGFSVNKRRWQFDNVDREWARQKNCWMPMLEWADRHAQHCTITARWFSLWFSFRSWDCDNKTDAQMIADQVHALVHRIRRLG